MLMREVPASRWSGDIVFVDANFVGSDDAVDKVFSGLALERNSCAKQHLVGISHFANNFYVGQAFLQIVDAMIDFTQLFFAVVILGVLRAIAFGSCGRNRSSDLCASRPQCLEFFLQPRVTQRGDVG